MFMRPMLICLLAIGVAQCLECSHADYEYVYLIMPSLFDKKVDQQKVVAELHENEVFDICEPTVVSRVCLDTMIARLLISHEGYWKGTELFKLVMDMITHKCANYIPEQQM